MMKKGQGIICETMCSGRTVHVPGWLQTQAGGHSRHLMASENITADSVGQVPEPPHKPQRETSVGTAGQPSNH